MATYRGMVKVAYFYNVPKNMKPMKLMTCEELAKEGRIKRF